MTNDEVPMSRFFFITLALFLSLSQAARSESSPTAHDEEGRKKRPVQTVESVELERYLGKWFEIARIENEFQIGCRETTAEYTENADQSITVINQCVIGDQSQTRVRQALGRAWIQDKTSSAKLKVSFVHFLFWWKAFAGNYWILGLGPINADGLYDYALVGEPGRRYAWVLSRRPSLDEATYQQTLEHFRSQGYDVNRFVRTSQAENSKSHQ